MTSNAKSQEAEFAALALIRRIQADSTWRTNDNTLWPDINRVIREAESAPPEPASGGEAVPEPFGWFVSAENNGHGYQETFTRSPVMRELIEASYSDRVEATPLWAHPPTEPVAGVGDRLERLAKKWERVADEQGVVTFTGAEHRLFANELRAIIGTAPADGGSNG